MKKILLTLISTLMLGTIVKAQLNGNWGATQVITPTTANAIPYYVSTVDTSVCWMAKLIGNNLACREIARTIDAGQTWTSTVITTSSNTYSLASICALNADTAYTCFYGTAGGGAVYVTTNGGTTWTKQTSAAYTSASFGDFVYFFNDSDGVTFGDPVNSVFEIYTTSNGGANWTVVPSANIPAPNSSNEYGLTSAFSVVGNTIWAGTTEGRIYKSIDKGLNWTVINTNTGLYYIGELAFKNDSNGMAIVTDGQGGFIALVGTADAGTTWDTIGDGQNDDLGGFYQPASVAYVPGTTGTYVLTAAGMAENGSSYTTDDGLTWINIDAVGHIKTGWKSATVGWASTADQVATINGASRWDVPAAIHEISKNNLGAIYPNPASERFTVVLNDAKATDVKVSVYDIIGNNIYSKVFKSSSSDFRKTINCSEFSKGAYIVKIENNGNVAQSKLIIN